MFRDLRINEFATAWLALYATEFVVLTAIETSIVTMMYFAPQLGQAKAIGADLLARQRAGIGMQ